MLKDSSGHLDTGTSVAISILSLLFPILFNLTEAKVGTLYIALL
jgi:hypothetical protein